MCFVFLGFDLSKRDCEFFLTKKNPLFNTFPRILTWNNDVKNFNQIDEIIPSADSNRWVYFIIFAIRVMQNLNQ